MKKKVIIVDWSIFLHKAIFAYPNNPSIPPMYTHLNMILATLYKLGVDPDNTKILIALDGRNSWRKDFEKSYKENRQAIKDASGIDWQKWYNEFNNLVERLRYRLDWNFIGPLDRIEADDIISVACRFFTDDEIIIVSSDSDLQQCWQYPNVKI